MEALGHVFFYFLRGSLPWQGLKAATNKQKYEKIGEKKQQTSIKELCDGFPEEFGVYLSYCRKLGFEETPDYDHLRGLMTKVLQKIDAAEDNIYDWMLLDKDKAPRVRKSPKKFFTKKKLIFLPATDGPGPFVCQSASSKHKS